MVVTGMFCEVDRLSREGIMDEHDKVVCPRCAHRSVVNARPGEIVTVTCCNCRLKIEVVIESEESEAA